MSAPLRNQMSPEEYRAEQRDAVWDCSPERAALDAEGNFLNLDDPEVVAEFEERYDAAEHEVLSRYDAEYRVDEREVEP